MTTPSPLNTFFPRIYCVNLDRRTDRWASARRQFRQHNISRVTRHHAVDIPSRPKRGCATSHASVIRRFLDSGGSCCLVLEDDFLIVHSCFQLIFAHIAPHIPVDWDLLYLGGHYGSPPISRVNSYIIRCSMMLCVSSYAITRAYAQYILPLLEAHLGDDKQATDWFFSQHANEHHHYITSPRLIIQGPGLSDITKAEQDYFSCMLDTTHERMV